MDTLKKSDFYYDLPEELIAQDPLLDRSSSRLLKLNKETGKTEHHSFKDVKQFLRAGDTLVLNNTKVIPARLIGHKEDTGATIEVLLLKRKENDQWETLVDASENTEDLCIDYRELNGEPAYGVRLRILGAPEGITPGLVSLTTFGTCIPEK